MLCDIQPPSETVWKETSGKSYLQLFELIFSASMSGKLNNLTDTVLNYRWEGSGSTLCKQVSYN